ncbi:MAG TPA: hypothetical protein VH196_05440 [Terriglobales bacterium]|nr:hypothetical protein [Terriglobales bacterium]
MSKRTPKYGCPHCGSTEDFGEANVLKATAAVLSFDKRGEPIYAGESDVDWDSQTLDPSIEEPY